MSTRGSLERVAGADASPGDRIHVPPPAGAAMAAEAGGATAPSTSIADVGVAAAFRAASATLSLLPRRFTLPAARATGRVLWHLMPGRRAVALDNLRAALGSEMSEDDRVAMSRASFGHAAAIAMDLLTLPQLAKNLASQSEVAPGSLEAIRSALAGGRGALLVAGHFGLFESMGLVLGDAGVRLHFVSKPFDNAALDAAINRNRALTGNGFIHKGGAKAKAREVLARGECVAVVVDQHVTARDRAWIPFFGLPAATTRSLGALAMETGAPAIPIHAYPLPGGRVRCEFGPVIAAPSPSGDTRTDEAACEAFVTRVVAEMERATRKMPEAWLWMHRRWKVRPDGERGKYPAYSITASEDEARRARRRATASASTDAT